jgi:uncharacterized protein YutE (UPF0331/DUF86 family)
MYLKKKDVKKLLVNFKLSSIDDLKEKSTFIIELLSQNDWSFIIKSHAYLEAVVTQLIIDHLDESSLKGFVERLPLSDSQTGKIAILKELDILEPETRKFIRWFSELRNSIVHKVENIDFDLKSHFLKLDKNQ